MKTFIKILKGIGWFLFTCLLLFVLALWLNFAASRGPGCEDKEIVDIGGCDMSGLCGVKYADGTKGFQRLPVRGFNYTVCKEEPKKDHRK